ncbi:MAG: SAM-dependent methyltransferase [Clostridiales bacterium]|nr:SAM-dependent methyltransferase [Clostridiales bacterium]
MPSRRYVLSEVRMAARTAAKHAVKDIFDRIEKNMDDLVDRQADWTASAAPEQLDAARNGCLRLSFFDRNVPPEWLGDVRGRKVLCLAGAGGLQGPLFACAGADVTVFDLSDKMLEKDRETAGAEGLSMKIVKGNMTDLSVFADGAFDLVFNPPSLMYVPETAPVFRECFRVLKPGGVFILMAPAPVNYLCDWTEDEQGGHYRAVHRLPWCTAENDDSGWIEYGHTMEEYLGGLIRAGFVITGYEECQREDITELMFMVKAEKQ